MSQTLVRNNRQGDVYVIDAPFETVIERWRFYLGEKIGLEDKPYTTKEIATAFHQWGVDILPYIPPQVVELAEAEMPY